jgi:hypothetical protein
MFYICDMTGIKQTNLCQTIPDFFILDRFNPN